VTAAEFEALLSQVDFQCISEEELKRFDALFNLKLSEISWIMKCREYHRTHFTPDKENK